MGNFQSYQMANLDKLLQKIEEVDDYDLHDISCQRKNVGWCEWHMNIDQNQNVIRIAEKFHREFEKLKPSSSITREIHTMERIFLELLPSDHKVWSSIRECFKQARAENNPIPIIRAYTLAREFTRRLQLYLAVNTHHSLELYCTLLNCPILAQTEKYTEAFTKIFFHPKLDEYLVRRRTTYRGIVIEDKKLVDDHREGATIITTTFVVTSADRTLVEMFCNAPPGNTNSMSLFFIYNINNIRRYTALDVKSISAYPEHNEVLILRYVPFTIRSVQREDNGRRIEICLDELPE